MSILISVFSAALASSVPIALAGLGGTYSERAGILNLGLEGMMLMGAFGGVLGSHFTHNAFIGLALGMLLGAISGLLHAVLCIVLRINQALSGIIISMLGLGFTTFLLQMVWGNKGQSAPVEALPKVTVPLLSAIPVIGPLFVRMSLLVLVMLLLVVLSQIFLFRTSVGLKIRSVGEAPAAADSLGVPVRKIQFACVIVGGALAGLAGVSLSLGQLNFFQQNISGGRGWMGVAANIFGRWNPLGVLGASMLFAFGEAAQQHLTIDISDYLLKMIPYVLTITIIVISSVVRHGKAPASLGKLYERGER